MPFWAFILSRFTLNFPQILTSQQKQTLLYFFLLYFFMVCKSCNYGKMVNAGRSGEFRKMKECNSCGIRKIGSKIVNYGGYGS
tara:strand:- start:18 stop:266 length:249 start_codon:yes stop_codon:yes gene_type:complete